ncbi:hypothetical protein GCM10009122_37660 [Fulvivirga kasyanovii]|uniref:hypothetical protein n=1 Tax=Fulvivirga kasyanovii TaxID=396812 RepID=UPI0031D0D904
MTEIIKSRTIRPSTRQKVGSERYKIDTRNITAEDNLVVKITHESLVFNRVYEFSGIDLEGKKSIHFEVVGQGKKIDIKWSGALPRD